MEKNQLIKARKKEVLIYLSIKEFTTQIGKMITLKVSYIDIMGDHFSLVMQFFVYKYALAVLAGDIYFYIQYKNGFS